MLTFKGPFSMKLKWKQDHRILSKNFNEQRKNETEKDLFSQLFFLFYFTD